MVLALIWGSSFLFIKVGVSELHPLYVTLGRVTTGAVVLLTILTLSRARLPKDLTFWRHVTVIALFGAVIPFTLFGYGEQRVSSVAAGIWNATTPLFIVPMTLLFRTEKLTVRRVGGMLLGFLGVLVVLGVWQGVGGSTFAGHVMCISAAFCYAVAAPYQYKYLREYGRSAAIAVPTGQLLVASLILLILAPVVAGPPPAVTELSGSVVSAVLALGALGTGLAFVINFRVLRYAGATTSTSVTYLLPVVATAVGVLVLGEDLTWRQPVGAAIVLLGVAVSQGVLRLPQRRPSPSATGPVTATASSETAGS